MRALMLAAACATAGTLAAQNTTAGIVQVFDRPATSTLPLGTQFFELKQVDTLTTLPSVPQVADETSATVGPVTVRANVGDSENQPAPAATPLAAPLGAMVPAETTAPVANSLPIKVDKSSTAAQALQIARFEKQNQIGEAFLLASDLIRENPNEAFAYDAGIRTSLILGLHDDAERLYKQAIQLFPASGKYYVQLAHHYSRQRKTAELQALITEFEKGASSRPDAYLVRARLQAIAADRTAAKMSHVDAKQPYSIVRMQALLALDGAVSTQAAQLLSTRAGQDLEPFEARTLALELSSLASADPLPLFRALEAALANEADYQGAVQFADGVLDQLANNRKLNAMARSISTRADQTSITDAAAFVGARIGFRRNDPPQALRFLDAARNGDTPLVLRERANVYAESGNTTQAAAIRSLLLEEQPDDTALRLELGDALAALGDAEGIRRALSPLQMAQVEPQKRAAYLTLLTSATLNLHNADQLIGLWAEAGRNANWRDLQQMGDIIVGNAREDFRDELTSSALQRLSSDSQVWPLYGLLARLSGADGDFRSELGYYQKLVEQDSENIALLRFVAELATQHSSFQLTLSLPGDKGASDIQLHASDSAPTSFAVQLYQRLIELQPRVAENYSALTRAYQLRGEVEAAKRVAMEMADRGSSTSVACLAAAGVLEENGLTTDSLVYYRAAVLADEQNFGAWTRYADALRLTGKNREAELIFKRILENGYYGQPWNQPAVIASLLAIAHDTNRIDDLVQYLQTLSGQDIPGKGEFFLSASKLLMQLQQPALAEQFLARFIETYPQSRLLPDALLLRGQLQYTSSNLEAARATFLEIADKFTTSAVAETALFNAGETLRQQGKPAEAVETWKRLAQSFPQSERAPVALYEAALSAWTDLKDSAQATQLMTQVAISPSEDAGLVRRAEVSLQRMSEGKPPVVEE